MTKSPRGTAAIAKKLAADLRAGDCIALIGELGAGKTVFVRGLARALGVPESEPVTSPTFTVVNTYDSGRLPLYHFDLYRLGDVDELEGIGYRDMVGGDGIAVLEWADRVPDALPERHLRVEIVPGEADNERTVKVARVGD